MRWLLCVLSCFAASASAEQIHIAVAANFASPARSLAARFEQASGHRVVLSTGSTGKFYAQIRNGAPFDVFLSADSETPARMQAEGLASPEHRFTYALGRLALWSPQAGRVDPAGQVLRERGFKRLAIANPRLAPYGAAAQSVMHRLGVWDAMQAHLVLGESIAQAFQFVSSGNAELGFVAYSQVREPGKAVEGSLWLVPQELYAPIRQDAVLLMRARGNAAAAQLLDFLRSAPARDLIRGYGYDLP